ncbi:prolyl aminopeptidase [Spartinivicinus poritis]|uniref:Proline iminopeptidase n=1 Tax=Spartinivicinus poritis TaxID=2994640 RepID=A0ABT5U5T0_9GAMM|nr:prolyl aminopeptidase [Spartinivicinus sp. A2-2]MDE1461720.1 prolyl aminopeptidase [Spartinivicinus sp. A2-2]
MYTLYPAIKPYARHTLEVDEPHQLYLEESGNPNGIPVLYLHGGPGAACDKFSRRYFNPEIYRIILFDQRGAGRSTPHACIENNTTQDLIADIEAIRQFLNVDQWVLFGGSWGATLALLYAEQYPRQVLAMILRGVFLCREQDISWFYQEGANQIFPDYWRDFTCWIPEADSNDVINAYYKRLTGNDELARMGAAKAWALWEGHCATLRPNQAVLDAFIDPHKARALAAVACHYFKNKGFLEPNQILDTMEVIRDIPGIIVHGRYDMVCPLENAFTLQVKWPAAELHIVRDAGHSAAEPSISDALIRATDEMAKRLKPDLMPDEG